MQNSKNPHCIHIKHGKDSDGSQFNWQKLIIHDLRSEESAEKETTQPEFQNIMHRYALALPWKIRHQAWPDEKNTSKTDEVYS